MENETKAVEKKTNKFITWIKDHKVALIIGGTCVASGVVAGYILGKAAHDGDAVNDGVAKIDTLIDGLEFDANEQQYNAALNAPIQETLNDGVVMAAEIAEKAAEA